MDEKPRNDHVVLLRASAILLVVFGHATRSAEFPNPHMYALLFIPPWESFIRNYIYSFHMPLFFWISGYVYCLSLIHHPRTIVRQIADRFYRLVIPMYALSFSVLLPTILLFGHINGSVFEQSQLLLAGKNNDHLWFLKTLFIIFVVVIPLRHRADDKHSPVSDILIMCVWMALFFYRQALPEFLQSPVKYFPFFFVGYLHKKYNLEWTGRYRIYAFGGLVLCAINLITLFAGHGLEPEAFSRKALWYASAFSGVYFAYCLVGATMTKIRSSGIWHFIRFVDSRSYSIYLFHVSFLYMTLYLCYRLNIADAAFRIPVAFASGVLFPMMIHSLLAKSAYAASAFGIRRPLSSA